jgi:NhaP-type Na+/H+ and K+/H+ antiporter
MWTAIYDPNQNVLPVIETYFHPEYKQCINGVTLSRTAYIDHVIAQKNHMTITHIHYMHHLENETELFAIYQPKGKNIAGSDIETEVISYFLFQDEQIIEIKGQVRLIKGSYADVDMQAE